MEAGVGREGGPRSVDEFKTAVQAVLSETGVPGAGIALVRQSGVDERSALVDRPSHLRDDPFDDRFGHLVRQEAGGTGRA